MYLVASVHRWGKEIYYRHHGSFGPGFKWVAPEYDEIVSERLLTKYREYMRRL